MQKLKELFSGFFSRSSATPAAGRKTIPSHAKIATPGIDLSALESRAFPMTREDVASALESKGANPQMVAFVRANGPERFESLDHVKREVGRLAG